MDNESTIAEDDDSPIVECQGCDRTVSSETYEFNHEWQPVLAGMACPNCYPAIHEADQARRRQELINDPEGWAKERGIPLPPEGWRPEDQSEDED